VATWTSSAAERSRVPAFGLPRGGLEAHPGWRVFAYHYAKQTRSPFWSSGRALVDTAELDGTSWGKVDAILKDDEGR
jgi:hypothetical protein